MKHRSANVARCASEQHLQARGSRRGSHRVVVVVLGEELQNKGDLCGL
jgi:hypothetical protein